MTHTESAEPFVRYDVAHGVATLTLDSPHNRNALSSTLLQQLRQGLETRPRIHTCARSYSRMPAERSVPERIYARPEGRTREGRRRTRPPTGPAR